MFFTDIFNENFFDDIFSLPENMNKGYSYRPLPNLNIYEDDMNYFITAEIPGVDKENLKLNVVGKTLTIEGNRQPVREDANKVIFYRRERPCGDLKRTISLNDTIDTNSIKAKLKDGILLIVLKKTQEHQTKEIKIS